MKMKLVFLFSVVVYVTTEVINQHDCSYNGYGTLVCVYRGDGVYTTDRRIAAVTNIVFDKFGGGHIVIEKNHLPNLETLTIKEVLTGKSEICESVRIPEAVRVFVGGELCTIQGQDNSEGTTQSETRVSVTEMSFTISRKEKQTTAPPSTNPSMTLAIVVTVLTVLLLVVLARWVKLKLAALLQAKQQRQSYRPSMTERMRARAAMRNQQNVSSPV